MRRVGRGLGYVLRVVRDAGQTLSSSVDAVLWSCTLIRFGVPYLTAFKEGGKIKEDILHLERCKVPATPYVEYVLLGASPDVAWSHVWDEYEREGLNVRSEESHRETEARIFSPSPDLPDFNAVLIMRPSVKGGAKAAPSPLAVAASLNRKKVSA